MTIPLAVPNLNGNEAAYLQRCIETTFVSSVGEFVNQFEGEIANVSGTQSACVLSSGTVSLQMALQALGVGQGDLVIVPSLTFIATPNAVSHSGAEPWLFDVMSDTWMLDAALVRTRIEAETTAHPLGRLHTETGKILKVIMPVMIMGAVPDFQAYVAIAQDFGLKIVVDAAAAIGTTYKGGIKLGETGVDAVCYSFNGNKTLTCGGGGAVAAKDPELIDRLKHLTSTGRVGKNYDHDIIAYNHRMTNVQAALGLAQIERLGAFLERKKEIRDHYADFSEKHVNLSPFPNAGQGEDGHWFSGFWYTADVDAAVIHEVSDKFRDHMVASGVDLRPFWKPIHLQTPYLACLRTDMPVADDVWIRLFPLPCSTHLTDQELKMVTEAAAECWSNLG